MKPTLLALITALMLIVFSCKHSADLSIIPAKPSDPGPMFKCSHDSVYFYNSVFPVILSGCAKSGCHDANAGEDFVLDNYNGIMELVTPFRPEESPLYYMLYSNEEERMPPDKPLSAEGKSVVYWWISQGARNNRCDSAGCDTTDIGYTKTISPITGIWCTGCHSGPAPANGISLEGYTNMVNCAESGRLTGALRHEYGYQPMPKGGVMLAPCEIDLFQSWIDLGFPQ